MEGEVMNNNKKLTQRLTAILEDPNSTANDLTQALAEANNAIKGASPWWVIVLKTLAYLIGLLLAGYGTTAAAQTLSII